MATLANNTPTKNLFAVLADDPSTRPAPAPKPQPTPAEPKVAPTPKARAEVKAKEVQKKEAKKKTEEATPVVEDLEGFSLQRNQRQKEKRFATQEPPKENNNDGKSFKGKKQFKKDGASTNDFNGTEGGTFKETSKQGGFKGEKQNQTQEFEPRRRDFDKQSQGKYPRKPYQKKQGHGKANWGDEGEQPSGIPTDPSANPTVTDEGSFIATETSAVPNVETPTEVTEEGVSQAAEEALPEEEKAPVELSLEDFLKMKEEKQKELEALVGATRDGPRSLSDDEKKTLEKFQHIENTKSTKVTKEATKTNQPKDTQSTRKGEKTFDLNFQVSTPNRGGRGGGRGGRGGRQPRQERENSNNETQRPRGGGRGGRGGGGRGQKVNKNDFPTLG